MRNGRTSIDFLEYRLIFLHDYIYKTICHSTINLFQFCKCRPQRTIMTYISFTAGSAVHNHDCISCRRNHSLLFTIRYRQGVYGFNSKIWNKIVPIVCIEYFGRNTAFYKTEKFIKLINLPPLRDFSFQLIIPDHLAAAALVGLAVLVGEVELNEPVIVE